MSPAELAARWRAEADAYARDDALVPAERLLRRLADELEAAWTAWLHAELTLAEAAAESGYSVDRLRELVAEGRLPAIGTRAALRVRRADLPRRPGRPAVVEALAAQVETGRRRSARLRCP